MKKAQGTRHRAQGTEGTGRKAEVLIQDATVKETVRLKPYALSR